jgi:hypothetical protein
MVKSKKNFNLQKSKGGTKMAKKHNSKPPAASPRIKKKSPSKITPLEALARAYDITIFQVIAATNHPGLWEVIEGEVIGGGEAKPAAAQAIHEYLQKYAAKAKSSNKAPNKAKAAAPKTVTQKIKASKAIAPKTAAAKTKAPNIKAANKKK